MVSKPLGMVLPVLYYSPLTCFTRYPAPYYRRQANRSRGRAPTGNVGHAPLYFIFDETSLPQQMRASAHAAFTVICTECFGNLICMKFLTNLR